MENESFKIDNPYTQLLEKNAALQRENDELRAKLATTKTCLENTRSLVEARDKQLYFKGQMTQDLQNKIDRYREVILWLIDIMNLPKER